jgi:hypothetical protein
VAIDDILDPMATLRRLEGDRLRREQQRLTEAGNIRVDPLPEEREQKLLPKIGSAALGGLGFVGGTLEKLFGGRAVRGLLGGRPEEILSLIPGSDLMGITDEANRVSGRDLLRQWGVAGEEDNWGNFLGGIGAEIALDPSMYLTFGTGALTKAGQVARKAGVLPSGARARVAGSLDDLLQAADPARRAAAEIAAGGPQQLAAMGGESLGGLVGVKLPFSELFGGQAKPLLTGQAGEKALDIAAGVGSAAAAANEALGKVPLVGGLSKVAPAIGRAADWTGRHLGALFDSTRFGATTALGRDAAQARHAEILPFVAKYREKGAGYAQELAALGAKDTDELRLAIEGVRPSANQRVNDIAKAMRDDYLEILQTAQREGLKVDEFMDPLNPLLQYSPRQWSAVVEGGGAFGPGGTASALRASDASLQSGRQAALSGFSEGTVGVNKLFQDAAVYDKSLAKQARQAYIQQNYLTDAAQVAQQRVAAGQAVDVAAETKDILRQQKKQTKQLVKMLDQLPDQYRQAAAGSLLDKGGKAVKLTPFGHNPVDEYLNYVQRFGEMRARGLASQDLLSKNYLAPGAALPQGAVPIQDALRAANLTDNIAYAPGMSGQQVGASAATLDRINAARQAAGEAPLADLKGVMVTPDAAGEIGRIVKDFGAPEAVNPFVRGLDYLTNLFKTNVTTYWPGFNLRNFLSGQFMNASQAGLAPLGDVGNAYRMLAGGTWEGLEQIPAVRAALQAAGRPATAEEATKQLARWQFAYNVGGHSPNVGREVVTAAGDTLAMPRTLDDVAGQIPGEVPKGIGTVKDILLGRQEGTSYRNPLAIAGVGAKQDAFTPVVAGRALGDVVENANRTPLFVNFLREGYSPEEAARRVLGSHYDYSRGALTAFERSIMRRLIPFYSFTRQNVPNVVGQLATNPGGLAGGMAKLSHDLRQQGGFLPAYMGDTLAIPVGQEEGGMQRYLTRLDLPPDQAFDFFKGFGSDPLQAAGMGLLGQLNPILKGPAEYFTNKQFFSGRELGDLDSLTGNILADQLLLNSPLARFGTTYRQITHPQADPASLALNLLTGAKVTDVDMPKYKAIAEREYIEQRLRGSPAVGRFQTLSVRPDQLGRLTPDELELVQLQRLLEKRAREAKKAARSGAGSAP